MSTPKAGTDSTPETTTESPRDARAAAEKGTTLIEVRDIGKSYGVGHRAA